MTYQNSQDGRFAVLLWQDSGACFSKNFTGQVIIIKASDKIDIKNMLAYFVKMNISTKKNKKTMKCPPQLKEL